MTRHVLMNADVMLLNCRHHFHCQPHIDLSTAFSILDSLSSCLSTLHPWTDDLDWISEVHRVFFVIFSFFFYSFRILVTCCGPSWPLVSFTSYV